MNSYVQVTTTTPSRDDADHVAGWLAWLGGELRRDSSAEDAAQHVP